MAEQGSPSDSAAARHGLFSARRLVKVAAITIGGLLALYFVVTSGAFLKRVVLPRVSQQVNAKVSVGDISFSPFSRLSLKQLKVETAGAEPLLVANEASVKYSLFALMAGRVNIASMNLAGVAVNVTVDADGKTNLDPLLASKSAPAPPARESKPLIVDLKKVVVTKGNVRFTRLAKDGSRTVAEVSELELAVEGIKNDGGGKLSLSAVVAQRNQPALPGANSASLLASKMTGGFEFTLDKTLFPTLLKGDLRLNVTQAQGVFRDLSGLGGVLACDVSPSEVRQVSLRFEKGGQRLGQVQIRGPFDITKYEGRLRLEVTSVDRHALNLLGAPFGLDFGETKLNANSQVDLSQRGQTISAKGGLSAVGFTVSQGGRTTRSLDWTADYQFTLNLPDNSAVLQKFSLAAKQRQADLLTAALDRPMNLAWGEEVHGLNEATIKVALNGLDLADWRLFLGPHPPEGKLDLQGSIISRRDGREIAADISAKLRDLALTLGTNRLDQAGLQVQLRGNFSDFKTLVLDQFNLDLEQQGRQLLTATGSGGYHLNSRDATLQVSAETDLPSVLRQFPVAELRLATGRAKFSVLGARQKGKQTINARLALDRLDGQLERWQLKDLLFTVDCDAELTGDEVVLRRGALSLRHRTQSGGSLDAGGVYDLKKRSGNFTFNVVDLNQTGLRPFLAPFLAPINLTFVSVGAKGSAHYEADGQSSVQLEAVLAKLLLKDPENRLPNDPLNARLQAHALYRPGAVDVKQATVLLNSDTAGTNEVQLLGKVSLTNKVSELTFVVNDLNERALAPLLNPALAPSKLASLSLNGRGSLKYDPKAQGHARLLLQLGNLSVQDEKGNLARLPKEVKLELEANQQQSLVGLQKAWFSLPPTERAKNVLLAEGKLDFSTNNAAPSSLKVTAESLDFTPLYGLLRTNKFGAASGTASGGVSTPGAATSQAGKELTPARWPLQQCTANLKIDRLYLGEVVVSNWVATARLTGGELTLNPCQLALNGSPVSAVATLDLGRPGYTYSLDLKADRVPLEPLVNTLAPDKRGQFQGEFYANGRVQGAGTTGASLQQSLRGQLAAGLTNVNLQVVGPKWQQLLTPIALVLQAPELRETPLNVLATEISLGNGEVQFSRALAVSRAFVANVTGKIQLAEVLTNSPLNLPVQLALRRQLAERARLVSANTPPDAQYVQLPAFVAVKGTLGDPKTEIDKTKLLAQGVDTAGQLIGGKAGDLMQGVGGLLKGEPLNPANLIPKPKTDARTNAPPKLNPLDLLPGLLQPKK
jgi:hypothetical protein